MNDLRGITPMMTTTSLVAAAAMICGCTSGLSARPDHAEWLRTGLRSVAAQRDIHRTSIGQSREGRSIDVLRIGDASPEHGALLIIAGLDGQHRIGSETALAIASHLGERWEEIGAGHTVYVIPAANPDNAAWQLADDHPLMDFGGALVPVDEDRDRRLDEDGPQDLNGDGRITMMRIANPPIGSGLERTHLIDPDEPRLMREPKSSEGEHATHAYIVEGRDADGDGRIAEDGPGAVNLNRNFPYRWPEHQDDAGRHQLSEPETLAIAQWMLEHNEIVCVLVYGPDDTLMSIPVAGKTDDTRRVPLGILDEDKAAWEVVAARFKEHTGMTKGSGHDLPGSLLGWSYAHFGAFSFGTPVWIRPDLVEAKETDDEQADEAAEADESPASEEESSEEKEEERKKPSSDDGWWLRYSDDDRDGAGFVDWMPFEHPDLGPVEIGGFEPGFRMNPPAERAEALAEEQSAFVVELLDMLPRLEVDSPLVESLGGDIWRITLRLRNDGTLPMRPMMSARTRRLAPLIASLDVDADRIIAGNRRQSVGAIDGGGSREITWTLIGAPGSRLTIELQDAVMGDRSIALDLEVER